VNKQLTIDKAPLGQKAADIIRSRIIEGIYPQGSRLIEEDLAYEFNISRACVRDAFLMLESEGMVRRERNKCTTVLTLSPEDIEHLFKFRMAMELLAVETCIAKGCVPKEKLEKHLKSLDRALAKSTVNPMEFVEADLDFHEAIIRSAGNPYLGNVFRSIKYQIMTLLFSLYSRYTERFSGQGVEQHYRMIETMVQGDIEKACRHVREHIQNNLDFVMELNERIHKT
jgi:DNA-binding GntR family transcriptional regulator